MKKALYVLPLIFLAPFAAANTCDSFTEDTLVAETNITKGLIPILNGQFGVGGWPENTVSADPDTLTDNQMFIEKDNDGVQYGENQHWGTDTVWWDARESVSDNNTVEFDLGGYYSLNKIIIQADTNDYYQVQYLRDGRWDPVWTAGSTFDWGMMARHSGDMTGSTVAANRIRIEVSGGDSLYSLSEVAVFGRPVSCQN